MPKASSYQIIDREEYSAVYELLESVRKKWHWDGLSKCRLAVAWQFDVKPDGDGRLMLGKAKVASELEHRLHGAHAIIVLNFDAWHNQLKPHQKEAVLDHELCHLQPQLDSDGHQKADSSGRLLFRLRRHEIEEFSEVVARHGIYKKDLERMYAAARRHGGNLPLFGDGEQPAGPRGVVRAVPPPPEAPPPAPAAAGRGEASVAAAEKFFGVDKKPTGGGGRGRKQKEA